MWIAGKSKGVILWQSAAKLRYKCIFEGSTTIPQGSTIQVNWKRIGSVYTLYDIVWTSYESMRWV